MKKLRLLLSITYIIMMLVLVFNYVIADTDNDKTQLAYRYIDTYKIIAVEEMHRIGVPASITLAQGLLESNYGRSRLARVGNNHFGIKCKSYWKGDTIRITDDAPNECFRKYRSVEESYVDHSNFLFDHPQDRYIHLFQLDRTNYKGWARGLKKAGYATAPHYAESLIKLIERYNLQQFDFMKPADFYIVQKRNPQSASVINRPQPVKPKPPSQLSQIGGVVYGVSDQTHSVPNSTQSYRHTTNTQTQHATYPWTKQGQQEKIVYNYSQNGNGANRPVPMDVRAANNKTVNPTNTIGSIGESYPKYNYPWNQPQAATTTKSYATTPQTYNPSIPQYVEPTAPKQTVREHVTDEIASTQYPTVQPTQKPTPPPQTVTIVAPSTPASTPYPGEVTTPVTKSSVPVTPSPTANTSTNDTYTRTIPTPPASTNKENEEAVQSKTKSRFVFTVEKEEPPIVQAPPVQEAQPSPPSSTTTDTLQMAQTVEEEEVLGGQTPNASIPSSLPPSTPPSANPSPPPPSNSSTPPSPPILIETVINGCKAVVTDQPIHMNKVSSKYGISLKKVRAYNDLKPNRQVPANIPIFLEKKKGKASKDNNEHIVERGETIELIAQKYGMRVKSIYKFNKQLYPGAQPVVGQVITLR